VGAKRGPCPVAEVQSSHVTEIRANLALTGAAAEQGAAESPGKSRKLGYVLWLFHVGF